MQIEFHNKQLITRRKTTQDHNTMPVSHRILLSLKEAAKVIGTQGNSIQSVRDNNNNVKIGISEKVPGCSDRVLTCSGEVEDVCSALGDVVTLLNKPSENEEEIDNHHFYFLNHLLPVPTLDDLKATDPEASEEALHEQLQNIGYLRLLVFNSQLSSIIGKGGNQIKSLIEKHGVKLVASRAFLPDSTERMLEIQGVPSAIKQVLLDICEIIAKEEEEEEKARAENNNGESTGRKRFERKYYPHLQRNNTNSSSNNGSVGNSANSQEYTATVMIPESYVGALAGKKGNRLANLRKFTKTKILMESRPNDLDNEHEDENDMEEDDGRLRKFTIIGSSSRSVNLAESMLQRNLATEIERRKERLRNLSENNESA